MCYSAGISVALADSVSLSSSCSYSFAPLLSMIGGCLVPGTLLGTREEGKLVEGELELRPSGCRALAVSAVAIASHCC